MNGNQLDWAEAKHRVEAGVCGVMQATGHRTLTEIQSELGDFQFPHVPMHEDVRNAYRRLWDALLEVYQPLGCSTPFDVLAYVETQGPYKRLDYKGICFE